MDAGINELGVLDGADRRALAEKIWTVWDQGTAGSLLLTGLTGLGKTQAIVAPLLRRFEGAGGIAVDIELPPNAIDIEDELRLLLIDGLVESGHEDLALKVGNAKSLESGLLRLLGAGAAVVIDEAQRLLGAGGRPLEGIETMLARIAARPSDGGLLWLVSNRSVDPGLSAMFAHYDLQPPDHTAAADIVLRDLAPDLREARFPAARRLEVVGRLAGNPRVLRLLSHLLNSHELVDLLGPPSDVPTIPPDSTLVDAIERAMIAKAAAGVEVETRMLLSDLTIVRGQATWGLIAAIGESYGETQRRVADLRSRFLIDNRDGRFVLNAAVRESLGVDLREDPPAWRSAHRRAAAWFMRSVDLAGSGVRFEQYLTRNLSEALFHLVHADDTVALREVLQPLSLVIERRFGSNSPLPRTASEADAQIELLSAFLGSVTGHPRLHHYLARLLRARGGTGDLETALNHATTASKSLGDTEIWVLRIQLLRLMHRYEEAVDVAKVAVDIVPAASVFSVFQQLASCLICLARPVEAIAQLLQGAERSVGNEYRLVEEAIVTAAAEVDDTPLATVIASSMTSGPQAILAQVLHLERIGKWEEAALMVGAARNDHPAYISFVIHETLGWLGAGEPALALASLSAYPMLRLSERMPQTWLSAVAHAQSGALDVALSHAETYAGAPVVVEPPHLVEWLARAWDTDVLTPGLPNPAFVMPVLPDSIAGVGHDVRRTQYGERVLKEVGASLNAVRRRYLMIATEWSSAHGGISTMNRQLSGALAAGGALVQCVVLAASPDDVADAETVGVQLLEPPETPGLRGIALLSRRPSQLGDESPEVIIGHGRITGPSALALSEDIFPESARLHLIHMAPDEIEWHKYQEGTDPAALAEERTKVEVDLSVTADRAFAVGPRLFNRFQTELSPEPIPPLLRLDPGFDSDTSIRVPPPGSPWRIAMFGRLEDLDLKGIVFGVRAISAAVEMGRLSSSIEVRVRGSIAGEASDLREQLLAETEGHVDIVVRNYTTDQNELARELKLASLVLMPSRVEGFGLAGLEAIVAGTPVLVSQASGLGELLQEMLGPQSSAVVLGVDDAGAIQSWASAIELLLLDRDAAFDSAERIRTQLAALRTWAMAAAVVEGGLPT